VRDCLYNSSCTKRNVQIQLITAEARGDRTMLLLIALPPNPTPGRLYCGRQTASPSPFPAPHVSWTRGPVFLLPCPAVLTENVRSAKNQSNFCERQIQKCRHYDTSVTKSERYGTMRCMVFVMWPLTLEQCAFFGLKSYRFFLSLRAIVLWSFIRIHRY